MLDDRAGLSAAYKILYETKERIKMKHFEEVTIDVKDNYKVGIGNCK